MLLWGTLVYSIHQEKELTSTVTCFHMLETSSQATVTDDPTNPDILRRDTEDTGMLPWKFQWLNASYNKASYFLYFGTNSLFLTSTTQLTGQPVSQLFKHGPA